MVDDCLIDDGDDGMVDDCMLIVLMRLNLLDLDILFCLRCCSLLYRVLSSSSLELYSQSMNSISGDSDRSFVRPFAMEPVLLDG